MVRFEWPTFPISDATERWLVEVQPYYLLPLEFAADREELPFDFTGESLPGYEEFIVDYFGDEQELIEQVSDTDDDQLRKLALGTMGYLGETLMRIGGGWWSNDEASGSIPGSSLRVHLDPQLGLEPVSPAHLLTEAVARRSGEEFTSFLAMVQQAVADQQAKEPGWEPVKIRLLGLDPPPPTQFLTKWLADKEQAFPEWAATYADHGTWDFRVGSVDALERLLRHELTYVRNDFADERERAMGEQAGWYLGEVMIRAVGGSWYYEPPVPGSEPKAGVGIPYVLTRPWHAARFSPIAAIWVMLDPDNALDLREQVARHIRASHRD